MVMVWATNPMFKDHINDMDKETLRKALMPLHLCETYRGARVFKSQRAALIMRANLHRQLKNKVKGTIKIDNGGYVIVFYSNERKPSAERGYCNEFWYLAPVI